MPKKQHKKEGLLERLEERSVLCAEGYLFEMERRGYLQAGAFVPEVVLEHPEALKQFHREMLRAGSDVIEAFTYYAHRDKLRTIGREDDLEPMNRQALRLAKEVADEGDALMAGNICNSWVYDHENPEETGEAVRKMYDEQVKWAAEEGADFIIAETLDYVGEAEIALEVIKKHNLPAVIMFSSSRGTGKTVDGYDLVEACQVAEKKGADVVGFNCSIGPEAMLPRLKKLRKAVKCYTAALPVPYHTKDQESFWYLEYKGEQGFPAALDPFLCTRGEMADFAKKAHDIGIEFIGVCCGGAPHHVRSMAEALGRKPEASKYSPNLKQHGSFGDDTVVKKHEKKVRKEFKSNKK